MIIDKINEVLPKEFQDKKEGYALTSESFYNEDYKVNMTEEEYKEEYKDQSSYQDDQDDAQEVDTSVFM